MVELGIVDIREIIRLIKSNFNFDFSNFALTSLKYRLEHIIAKNNLSTPESLYRKLLDEKGFFDTFVYQLLVSSTEMFRDPSVWRWIREDYFTQLDDKAFLNFKVWIPFCVSGGELFSLSILLKELNIASRVKVYATVYSDASLAKIKSGEYSMKKIEVSVENYKRFKGARDFKDYYKMESYMPRRDVSLIKNVEFIKDDLNISNPPKNVKLILMRNSMIYFNPSYQETVLRKIHQALSASGTLIIGLKECISNKQNTQKLFEEEEINERVYKRRIG